ncbi:MAG: exodeoxyribonuclease VII large subunit [Planctomycetaceae bacterium]
MNALAPAPQILSVSQLTRELKDLVEASFPHVAVWGEISSCSRAGSGHYYFTLKDEHSQLRAILWRNAAARLRFDVHDGLDVVAVGPIEIYEARGSYQMIVEELLPRGLGPLELAFRQLQAKLEAEGLFHPARKRPLPKFPRRIALVTSPTSAAVRDMLQVITRRWPGCDVVLVPVAVQGAGAAAEIADALRNVHRIPNVDVVIAGRGGGSLEDLWSFNEEVVARAIVACRIPVISAVGHEIDVTIADLVADVRALTPSEAGEIVVPNRIEILNDLTRTAQRMTSALRERSGRARDRVDSIATRRIFTRPYDQVHDYARRLDELGSGISRRFARRIESLRHQVDALSQTLHALSPLNVLGRGYSITRKVTDGVVLRDATQVAPGEVIETVLDSGTVTSRVESSTSNFDTQHGG